MKLLLTRCGPTAGEETRVLLSPLVLATLAFAQEAEFDHLGVFAYWNVELEEDVFSSSGEPEAALS